MPGLDSDYKEALHYAIKNCPARTIGQLAAIEFAERAIREDLSVLTALERKTLTLELGLWLTRYQRIREFSASSETLARTDSAAPGE
ncbi:hypothetical protein BJP27_23430 [Pseudomonas oryzihabitans]|nr:hypothetical protein BJP27_23430 [Pseudomonas psychrotolerans]